MHFATLISRAMHYESEGGEQKNNLMLAIGIRFPLKKSFLIKFFSLLFYAFAKPIYENCGRMRGNKFAHVKWPKLQVAVK
jgi:hypothetical protein